MKTPRIVVPASLATGGSALCVIGYDQAAIPGLVAASGVVLAIIWGLYVKGQREAVL